MAPPASWIRRGRRDHDDVDPQHRSGWVAAKEVMMTYRSAAVWIRRRDRSGGQACAYGECCRSSPRRRVPHLQPRPEQPCGPMRHAQALRRRLQRLGDDPPRVDPPRLTWLGNVVQPGRASVFVAGPPGQHRLASHPDPLCDLGVPHTLRSQQHDPRPLRQPRPHTRRPSQALQLGLVALPERQRRRRTTRHTPSSAITNRLTINDTLH
jgi:hypothetical protein